MKRYVLVMLLFLYGAVVVADTPPTKYRPIATVNPAKQEWDATIYLERRFDWAAQAQTLKEAEQRWGRFLKQYDNGQFEEPIDFNYVRSARFELMRVYYLLGKVDEADALARKLLNQ